MLSFCIYKVISSAKNMCSLFKINKHSSTAKNMCSVFIVSKQSSSASDMGSMEKSLSLAPYKKKSQGFQKFNRQGKVKVDLHMRERN